MGDRGGLEELLRGAGLQNIEVESHSGRARFPSVRTLLESDLRGWLPIMGVNLSEELISTLIEQAERQLSNFVTAAGELEFTTRALIATGQKPASD